MAKWWKRWIGLAGGLASVTSWLTSVSAQDPGYQPPMPTGGPAPLMTSYAAPTQPNPQSFDYHGETNGFHDGDYYSNPQPYVFKLKYDSLLWHVAMPRINNVLATTSTLPNLQNGVGAIADPGTVSILGPGTYDYRMISGGRVTAGLAPGWFLPVEVSGFWASPHSMTLLNVISDGTTIAPVLARPFQAPNLPSLNGQGPQVVLSAGFPGTLSGAINVAASMSFWGFETNLFLNLGSSDVLGLDALVGYRNTNLHESLRITNAVQSVDAATNISFNEVNPLGFPPGFTSTVTDLFQTRNQFNGATIGLRPALYVGQFSLLTDLKLSMGSTHQVLNVNGQSSLLSPDGTVQTFAGGLLAVASNSGIFSRDVFSVIPEANINVGFNLNRNIRFFAAYNVFFWTNVIRPGDQINLHVDSRQVPTDPTFDATIRATQPPPPFFTRDFWGQGLSVGVEIGF